MILGAALLRYVISSAGVVTLLVLLAAWNAWRPGRRPRLTLIAAGFIYAVLSYHPLSHALSVWLNEPFSPLTRADVPAGRTAIVLLGSGSFTVRDWSDGQLSMIDPIGAERTLEAARVYKMVDAQWIISSGGEIDPEDQDQPSGPTMRDTLIGLGVPPDRVLMEDRSKTTRDEAVIVAAMLKPLQPDHVVLVTSGEHMRRSLAVFRAVGIEAIPAVAREYQHDDPFILKLLPSRLGLEESHYVAHEVLGLIYYRLRGWQR